MSNSASGSSNERVGTGLLASPTLTPTSGLQVGWVSAKPMQIPHRRRHHHRARFHGVPLKAVVPVEALGRDKAGDC